MYGIILTQNSTPVIGQVAWILGKMMEGIFFVIDKLGIPNIGLAIILFTIVINFILLPFTIKQQKFSKLQAKMNPEIQAIQNKYKNRKDQDSQIAMSQETQAVYAKYGVSPTGSCMYLLIQMPIMLALYRVIYSMPAYVTKIGDTFRILADKIISTDNASYLANTGIDSINRMVSMYGGSLTKGLANGDSVSVTNGVIDILNKLTTSDLNTISGHYGLSNLTYNGHLILSNGTTRGLIDIYNNFLGLNMGNDPSFMVKQGWSAGHWGLIIGAILIPVLAAVTQWINVKLMPQPENNNSNANDQAAAMQNSMKTMNMIMPLMSAWFCFTLPAGMGLYWIAGSVVRSIQQILINKHIDKIDFDELIQKNSVKSAKKIEKMKAQQEKLNAYANMNTKRINNASSIYGYKNTADSSSDNSSNTTANSSTNTTSSAPTSSTAKPGSMIAKANMVRNYNEKNNK